jgi:hypothetical protein
MRDGRSQPRPKLRLVEGARAVEREDERARRPVEADDRVRRRADDVEVVAGAEAQVPPPRRARFASMDPRVAYFSMEVGFESSVPTYSGGLGVLAGDTLRSCADLGLPVVGVTLAHRGGYFRRIGERRGLSRTGNLPLCPISRAISA